MTWLNPSDRVRRFTPHQIVQHWAAAALGGILALSAAWSSMATGAGAGKVHLYAGLAGTALFLYHLLALAAIGIRFDVPLEKVAFLPLPSPTEGKYSTGEKWDYLHLLGWSALLMITGILLRWPGRLGIPGPRAFSWLRVVHAGCGAAWVVHLFTAHISGRWFRAPSSFRSAIFSGTVPLADAEGRPGWIADLVSSGVLVPVPEAAVPEDHRESLQVRDLLEDGNRFAREERFEEAARAFEEALALFPEYSQARFNLAIARMRQGRSDLAEAEFRKFVESDPFNPMAGKAKELLRALGGKGTGGQR